MKGRSLTDFISELYNNPEMEFDYRNNRYMISGYVNSTDDIYTLELWNITANELMFRCSDRFRENCVEQFEASKPFDGRTIYEAEDEINVQYG